MLYLQVFFMALWGLAAFLVVEICTFVPLYLVGIPAAWLASRYARSVPVPSRIYPDRLITAYANPIMNWWVGNYEDGISVFGYSVVGWYLRNPVTNLRFVPVISTLPSPNTHWVGTLNEVPADGVLGWFLAWSGPYVGFLWQWKTPVFSVTGIWIGWKINPRDAFYIPADDYRRSGLGTAFQIMRFH